MAGWSFDGNHVLDAYAATRLAVERCRRGEGPVLLLAETFRMGGHATHDEKEARQTFPAALFEKWGRRDPIGLYEEFLRERGITTPSLAAVEASVTAEVEQSAEAALADRDHLPRPESALEGVYAEDGGGREPAPADPTPE
jgi:TPP-dependent pyruvate/acetoin dehydrogenase alpha subunit